MGDSILYPIAGFTDPFSSLSHLLGAGVFAILAIDLVRRGRGSVGRMIALGVFGFACVFLLSISGVYHLLARHEVGRAVLERLDHAAIFVLIAGTFTPAHALLFRGLTCWVPLVLIWAAAIAGITLKTVFFKDCPEWLGLTLYLGLGWVGVFSMVVMWRRWGPHFVRPLNAGALAYTVGAVLEFWRWPILLPGVIGPHELFHVAVLAGMGFHWAFVCQFASGATRVKARCCRAELAVASVR